MKTNMVLHVVIVDILSLNVGQIVRIVGIV